MPIYTVHAPDGLGATPEAAARVALVGEGFSKSAFFFGPFWLIANGLWRALLGWAAVEVAILAAIIWLRLPPPAAAGLNLLVAIWLGLEAGALQSAALRRRGLGVVDVAVAPDEEVGERAFFARWREGDAGPAAATSPQTPRAPRASVLGLFPEPGGRA